MNAESRPGDGSAMVDAHAWDLDASVCACDSIAMLSIAAGTK